MNSIQIIISNVNYHKTMYIDVKNNTITTNNNTKKITKDDINRLLRIIRKWHDNYPNSKTIDPEKFIIKINNDNQTSIIEGNGSYPENYQTFKEWIGDFYE